MSCLWTLSTLENLIKTKQELDHTCWNYIVPRHYFNLLRFPNEFHLTNFFKLKKIQFATSHLEFTGATRESIRQYLILLRNWIKPSQERFSFGWRSSQSDTTLEHLLQHWEQADTIAKAWNCFKGCLIQCIFLHLLC